MADKRADWDGWGTPPEESDAEADRPTVSDYDIGYKKPPKYNRWPKGTSGNPKGPKKKGGSVAERVQALLDQKVTTTAGERLSYSDAILRTAVTALLGKGGRSIKSAIELINFLERFDKKVGFSPSPADETRLAELLRELAADLPPEADDA